MRIYRTAILLLLLPLNVWAEQTLFTAVYEGEYSNWDITLTRKLLKTDSGYLFTSEIENFFASIEESSRFDLDQRRMLPSEYRFQRKILGRKKVETIDFNWPQKSAVYHRSDKPEKDKTHKLSGHLLDPSLYQLQLQADVANQIKDLDYRFIKRKRVKHYRFISNGGQTFKLGDKNYPTEVVIYQNKDKNKRTEVWLLPDVDYQIAKIIHRDSDGDTYSIELKEYQAAGNAVTEFYQRLIKPEARPSTPSSATTSNPSAKTPPP